MRVVGLGYVVSLFPWRRCWNPFCGPLSWTIDLDFAEARLLFCWLIVDGVFE